MACPYGRRVERESGPERLNVWATCARGLASDGLRTGPLAASLRQPETHDGEPRGWDFTGNGRPGWTPGGRGLYQLGRHLMHMTRLLLLAVALPLAACGGGASADPASDVSLDASGNATSSASTPQPSPDPTASNPGMSRDSLLTSRERLERAADRYRQIADGGGWPSIPGGDLVEPGDTASAQVQALRDRLAATDELQGAAASGDVLDDRLAGALAAFQARHGLSVDSLLGGNTRASLNVPASQRVAEIDATLDRWDDLPAFPDGPDDRYVIVNVPEFRVRGFEGDREAIQMEVVVGAAYDGRETPLFHDEMEEVVFRPYWNVPPSIATEELAPQGTAALEEQGVPGRPRLQRRRRGLRHDCPQPAARGQRLAPHPPGGRTRQRPGLGQVLVP